MFVVIFMIVCSYNYNGVDVLRGRRRRGHGRTRRVSCRGRIGRVVCTRRIFRRNRRRIIACGRRCWTTTHLSILVWFGLVLMIVLSAAVAAVLSI